MVLAVTGWKAEDCDRKYKYFRSRRKAAIEHKVKLSDEYPKWLKDVYNQKRTESYVTNATAAAYRLLANKENEADPNFPIIDDSSRLFNYYFVRFLDEPYSSDPHPTLGDYSSKNRNTLKSPSYPGMCSINICYEKS